MGQKTEFNLDDWEFPEEQSSTDEADSDLLTTDRAMEIDDYDLLDINSELQEPSAELQGLSVELPEPSAEFQEPSAEFQEPSVKLNNPSQPDNNSSETVTIEISESLAEASLIEVQANKLHIAGLENNLNELTQEEIAFKRQIEDLFELLEMEKNADKKHGVRVYQTDPSPSKPWRFH